MALDNLILDRYEPIGSAGEGGFGTVEIAWDPRIQRKVAIKTIKLTAQDAYRAALPGARAVSVGSTADRWHGAVPWDEYLEEIDGASSDASPLPFERDGEDRLDASEQDGVAFGAEERNAEGWDDVRECGNPDVSEYDPSEYDAYDAYAFDEGLSRSDPAYQVTSLAHIPGLDEARTAAMLSDPRIVTVYDFEIRGRYAYLIMEYVEGITLSELLAEYPNLLTLDMVAAVFDSMAGALTVAHTAGVLHLDIKPDNILINPQGQVKVTDFGLATLADASGSGTTGGGTIGYMPLEQMRREHLDARTDEWSLAAVTYEMLTGDNPFRARTLADAEVAIEEAELILPSLCWSNLDEETDDVVFYALDPDREERYESVSDFAEEMDKFLGDPVVGSDQLSLVVTDALGLGEEEEEEESFDEEVGEMIAGPLSRLQGILGTFSNLFSRSRAEAPSDDYGYEDERVDSYADDYDVPEKPRRDRTAKMKSGPHEPVANRVPDLAVRLAWAFCAAVSSGFLAWFAFANMRALVVGLGQSAPYALGAFVLAIAALAAFVPHVAALIAYCLLSIAFILNGHPIVGAIVLVVTVAWWYTVGHEGKAAANVALSAPILGSVGLTSAVPLLAGVSLRPTSAIATTVLTALTALLFAALGSSSLFGWDAFNHWSMVGVSIEGNLIAMLTRVSTWAAIASWIAAALVLSAARTRNSRGLLVVGVVVAIALVLAGSLPFAAPAPQIIAPVLAAGLALIFLLV